MEIASTTVMVGERIGKYNLDARVMEVMGKVARHEFVRLELQPYTYLNRPIPIGYDKTISQPFIVEKSAIDGRLATRDILPVSFSMLEGA